MDKHPYYSKGTVENIIVSNTSMSKINPREGGHPQEFLNFFNEKKEEKELSYLENGKVIHAYIEDSSQFAIDDLDKPTDKICETVVEMMKIIESREYDFSLTRDLSSDKIFREMSEVLSMEGRVDLEKEDLISIFFKARENVKFQMNYKDDTIVKTFSEGRGVEYLMFLLLNSESHILSLSDKQKVESSIESLKNNSSLKNEIFEPREGYQMYKELGVMFMYEVKLKSGEVVKMKGKALLDNVQINPKENIVILNDLKTTSSSIYDMSPDPSRGYIGTVEKFRYYRQLAWYDKAIKSLLNPKIKTACFNSKDEKVEISISDFSKLKVYHQIIAVETTGYHVSGILPISSEWIKKGVKEYEELNERLAQHIKLNNWNKTLEELTTGFISMKNPLNT